MFVISRQIRWRGTPLAVAELGRTYDFSGWTENNLYGGTNVVCPDGVTRPNTYTESDDTGPTPPPLVTHGIMTSLSQALVLNDVVVFSVAAKVVDAVYVPYIFTQLTVGVTGKGSYWDLGTGVVGTIEPVGAPITQTITTVSTGWYRTDLIYTAPGAETLNALTVWTSRSGTRTDYTGSGLQVLSLFYARLTINDVVVTLPGG